MERTLLVSRCPPVFPVAASGSAWKNHGEHGRTRGRVKCLTIILDTLGPCRTFVAVEPYWTFRAMSEVTQILQALTNGDRQTASQL